MCRKDFDGVTKLQKLLAQTVIHHGGHCLRRVTFRARKIRPADKGVADALKGQVPVGLLVLKAGVNRPADEIAKEAVGLVRQRIGPVASFRTALVVERLPKTRSGKILRGTMRRIADGEDYTMPATIDDPAILGEIGEALSRAGYPQRK